MANKSMSSSAERAAEQEIELLDGCGYQGYEFGANYLDSVCLAGWLWDADSGYSIDGGWMYTHGGDIPCPQCNADEHLPQTKQEDTRDGE